MNKLPQGIILGIDAVSLLSGGGRTHLIELIDHFHPRNYGFTSVIVWGSKSTLSVLLDCA